MSADPEGAHRRMCELSDELAGQGITAAAAIGEKLRENGPTDVHDIAYLYTHPRSQRLNLAHALFAIANMQAPNGETPEITERRLNQCRQIVDAAGQRLSIETYSKLAEMADREQFSGGVPVEPLPGDK
jgi:hypothetical protein